MDGLIDIQTLQFGPEIWVLIDGLPGVIYLVFVKNFFNSLLAKMRKYGHEVLGRDKYSWGEISMFILVIVILDKKPHDGKIAFQNCVLDVVLLVLGEIRLEIFEFQLRFIVLFEEDFLIYFISIFWKMLCHKSWIFGSLDYADGIGFIVFDYNKIFSLFQLG